jgi:hypothetical protein
MRSLTRTGTALLTLALLTACSSGSSKSSAKETPPTKDTGTAAANAINLKKADLPSDWTSSPADNSDNTPDEDDKKLATCIGIPASDTTDLVDLNSDDFAKGQPPNGVQTNSEVEVVATLAQAERLRKGFSGDKAESCLETYFVEAAKAEAGSTPGVMFGTPTVTKTKGPNGTDGGFGFDISVPISGQGASITATFSIVGFFVKHTEVTLQTTSFGDVPSGYDQDDLVGKLVDRAKTSAV